ncbi:AAEL014914-PA [Aedes aegypti]|uniref:AAEL014914-PA n=1 Tax=Aedes aegypti TaxID=7159 RepID=Q16F36_AEDAE|nr:AAEL014914-PA [Aedes aegypti]
MMTTSTLRGGAIAATLLALSFCLISAEEFFGYNEEPENIPGRQNAKNRTAVFIPGKCGMNEILYPGDQDNDWVCDCRPAHVYHPGSNGCFPLYTRAYCAEDEFVEIKVGAKLPTCTKNPCQMGLVPFNGTCVKLHSNNDGVCPLIKHIKFVIAVNETTLQLECVSNAPVNLHRKVGNRYSQDPNVKLKEDGSVEFLRATKCAPGSAAEYKGACAESITSGVQPVAMEPIPTGTSQPVDRVGDVQPESEGAVD